MYSLNKQRRDKEIYVLVSARGNRIVLHDFFEAMMQSAEFPSKLYTNQLTQIRMRS